MKKEQEEQELKSKDVYIDSNLFIHAAIDDTEIGKKAREIITGIKDKRYKAYTSSLTFDEVLYNIQKINDKETALTAVELNLQLQNLEVVGVDLQIIKKMLEIYKTTNLKPRDSIHLAAMQSKNVTTIFSSDPDFDKIEGIKRSDFTKLRVLE